MLRDNDEIPKKGKGSKLSPKMELFVQNYLIDFNPAKACEAAGYKTKNPAMLGAELMRHPLIKLKIREGMDKKRERNEIKADYLINKLISIMENTETTNPQACLRAIELAGKSIALWKERQEISGPDGEAIQMEQKVNERAEDFTRKLKGLASNDAAKVVPLRTANKESE